MAAVAQPRASLAARANSRPALLGHRGVWTAVLLPFAITRALFVLLTITASWWIALLRLPSIVPTHQHDFIAGRWMQWDAVWYLRVAQAGYRLAPYANGHVNLAFFPLYPLAVHLLLPFGPWSPAFVAMAVSNASALGATLVFYRLIAMDFGAQIARRASWILAFFPTSLFFFAGYSEGAFLLFELLCVYCLRREYWWRAGLFGALATATRPTGLLMLVPAAVCWFAAHECTIASLRLFPRAVWPQRWATMRGCGTLAAVALVPCGLVAYMLYVWMRFGDPFAFVSSQRSWHRTWAWPWQTVLQAIERPLAAFPNFSADQLHGLGDFAYCIVFLALTFLGVRRLPIPYRAYLWAFWLLVLSTPALLDGVRDPLISLPRFLLTAFPLTVMLAETPLRARIALYVSVPLLVMNTLIFVSGGWVA